MDKKYTSFEELPLNLSVNEVAAVLGISLSCAYSLMHSKGFPTLHIGSRIFVPKDKLITWINWNTVM